ncbi:hypothetical protein [Hansschlegelia sp.]|nr:hypothetical protein [Hansschlegelia sp.]HVI27295.1 hypothetical protein [Hansschlegelia sp.]
MAIGAILAERMVAVLEEPLPEELARLAAALEGKLAEANDLAPDADK